MIKLHTRSVFYPGFLPKLVFVSILISPAVAAESNFLLEVGWGSGGERIQPSSPEANLDAGAGISVAAGVEFFLNEDKRQSLSVTYSLIFSRDDSSCAFCVSSSMDSTAKFDTSALNFLYQKSLSDDGIGPVYGKLFYHWVGIGLSLHPNPKYEFKNISGFADNTISFENATGLILQYSLRTAGAGQAESITTDFGIRHLNMEYDSDQSSFDASSTFLFWNLGF